MNNNDNHGKQNHIYDKQTRTWFEVTPEQFEEYDGWRTRIRKREHYHGRCMCPRSKWWLCDGMCQDCEYRRSNLGAHEICCARVAAFIILDISRAKREEVWYYE